MNTPLVPMIILLAAGTFVLRIAGPLLARRFSLAAEHRELLSEAAVVLLCALAATAALFDGAHLAGWARPGGVLMAILLLLVRAPFPVVVIGAAAASAALRYFGVH
jgi:branched-subunit amino acid transport protein